MTLDTAKDVIVTDATPIASARLADPFAVDIFAASDAANDASQNSRPETNAQKGHATDTRVAWHIRLPRVSRDELELARVTRQLPVALTSQAVRVLIETLSRFTNRLNENASPLALEILDARREPLTASAVEARSVFLDFTVEPNAARLAFAVSADFAVRLIDCTLGGDGKTGDEAVLRELSIVECAVIEFLALNIVRELNREAGASVLRFSSISNRPPSWLIDAGLINAGETQTSQTSVSQTSALPRGAMLIARLALAPEVECLARGFVPDDALAALSVKENRLLRVIAKKADEKQVEFRSLFSNVGLRVRIGESSLVPSDVLEIERGDAVLLTKSFLRADGAQLLAGEADNFRFTGRLNETDEADDSFSFQIKALDLTAPPPLKERWQMTQANSNRTDNEAADPNDLTTDEANVNHSVNEDEATERLGNLMLTVHVELAARRITLDELASLEANQIVELGCRATDPVSLIVEDRTVARGELIDIEGDLGVRITQVFR